MIKSNDHHSEFFSLTRFSYWIEFTFRRVRVQLSSRINVSSLSTCAFSFSFGIYDTFVIKQLRKLQISGGHLVVRSIAKAFFQLTFMMPSCHFFCCFKLSQQQVLMGGRPENGIFNFWSLPSSHHQQNLVPKV